MTEFIRLPDVCASVHLSRTTVYALILEGKFPKQVKLGPRSSAWVKDEIEAWKAARIAERDSSERGCLDAEG